MEAASLLLEGPETACLLALPPVGCSSEPTTLIQKDKNVLYVHMYIYMYMYTCSSTDLVCIEGISVGFAIFSKFPTLSSSCVSETL